MENILILSKRYSSESQILYHAALNNGWRVWRFVSRDIPDWVRDNNVSIYCETAFADYLAAELKVEFVTPRDSILAELPFEFVKRNIEFTTYKNFKEPGARKFIKPADYKYFPAGIYDHSKDIPAFSSCQDDDAILISDVVRFISEYRIFVMNNEIQTGSIYIEDSEFVGDKVNKMNLNSSLLGFAKEIVDSLINIMPSSYVLDIGKLDTGEYAVIEFNPVWASGFYDSDPDKVLLCIQAGSKRALL